MDRMIKLYHVSFRCENEPTKQFIPRIPNYALSLRNNGIYKEDDTTPRICFSDSIEDAILAIGMNVWDMKPGTVFTVYDFCVDRTHQSLVHPETLYCEGRVHDAKANREFWYLEPIILNGKKYEVVHAEGEMDISWDALEPFQIHEAFLDICSVDEVGSDAYKSIFNTNISSFHGSYECYTAMENILITESSTSTNILEIMDMVDDRIREFPWSVRDFFTDFQITELNM